MERKIHTEEEEKQYYSDTKKAEGGYHEAVEVKERKKEKVNRTHMRPTRKRQFFAF